MSDNEEYVNYWVWFYKTYWYLYDIPYKMFVFIISTIFTIPLAGFGAATNIVNLIVLFRRGLHADPSTPSLFAMSIVDFMSTFLGFVSVSLNVRNNLSKLYPCGGMYYGDLWFISYFMVVPRPALVQLSTWLKVYLSFETMMSVLIPKQVRIIFTPKRSYIVIGVISVLTLLLQTPHLLFEKMELVDNGQVKPYLWYFRSGLIVDSYKEHADLVNNVVFRTMATCFIIIFNIVSMVKLNLAGKSENSSTGKGNVSKGGRNQKSNSTVAQMILKEKRVVRMVFAICCVFMVCYLPGTIYYFIAKVPSDIWIPPFATDFMGVVMQFSDFVHTSFNMVIFYKMSSTYKKEMRQLCSCKCWREDKENKE